LPGCKVKHATPVKLIIKKEKRMKKSIVKLFVAAVAVVFLMVSVQPVIAGSEKTASDRTIGDKASSVLQSEKINLNTANLKTLSSLKGIGPERAKNILDYRSKNGTFKSIQELKKVKGIGDKIYSKIAPLLTVK
jgi:competence protein ComEA